MSRQGPGCRHPALVGPETVLFAGCYHLPPKLLFDNMRGGNASFSRPAMKHRRSSSREGFSRGSISENVSEVGNDALEKRSVVRPARHPYVRRIWPTFCNRLSMKQLSQRREALHALGRPVASALLQPKTAERDGFTVAIQVRRSHL